MPEASNYEVLVYTVRDGWLKQRAGTKCRLIETKIYIEAVRSIFNLEDGYITVSDLSNGREISRVDLKRAQAASA